MLKVLLVDASPKIETAIREALEPVAQVVEGPIESHAAADLVLVPSESLARILAETEKLRSDLVDRKVIERAKGILMKQRGCSEEEAFKALRTLAMQRGLRLGEVAQQVLDVSSLLG